MSCKKKVLAKYEPMLRAAKTKADRLRIERALDKEMFRKCGLYLKGMGEADAAPEAPAEESKMPTVAWVLLGAAVVGGIWYYRKSRRGSAARLPRRRNR